MAKSKKSTGASAEAASQMNRMMLAMETSTVHRIECFVCNRGYSDRDVPEASLARRLYEYGWRIVESEKLQTIGPACPRCVAKPDDKR